MVAERTTDGEKSTNSAYSQISSSTSRWPPSSRRGFRRGAGRAAGAVALPEVDTRTTAREEITVKTSPEALSMYHRFLSRLYPERKTRLTQSI